MRPIRFFFRTLWEMLTPKRWRFNCVECEDTGWVSKEHWVGWKGYRTFHHCPICYPTLTKDPNNAAK